MTPPKNIKTEFDPYNDFANTAKDQYYIKTDEKDNLRSKSVKLNRFNLTMKTPKFSDNENYQLN